jgi:hypothetical protein
MTVLAEIEDYRSSSIGALEGKIAAIPLNGGTIIVWDWEAQRRLHVVDNTATELLAVSGLGSCLPRISLSGSRSTHISY